jgi:anti-sigma regulatory factor (Ser/Thr protein kinase)
MMRDLDSEVFAATAEHVAEARQWLTGCLGSTHPACDDAVLLLSETFTNGVLYSDGEKIEVRVSTDDRVVHVEVVDGGGDALPHYIDDPGGEHGRGLPIMRALAHAWGFELIERGRLKVWFEI